MANIGFSMPPKLYRGVRLIMDGPCMENCSRLDMGALPMIDSFQRNGLYVDVPYLQQYGKWLEEDCKRIENEVAALCKRRINVGSGDQVRDLIFNTMGYRPRRKMKMTKGGKKSAPKIQLDDKALSGLVTEAKSVGREDVMRLALLVQDYRERDKLKGTYVDGLLPFVVWEGGHWMLHPNYKITTVETGRLAAENPNVLGIPVRSDLGKGIRKAFYVPEGWIMYTVDMSQIEIRWMAWWAGVANMLRTFKRNGDIHSETSARLFFHLNDKGLDEAYRTLIKVIGTDDSEVIRAKAKDPELLKAVGPTSPAGIFLQACQGNKRTPAKSLGLGVMYDISAAGLLEQLIKIGLGDSWDEEGCEGLIEDWFGIYPEVLSDRKLQHARARRFGYVWDCFGRIRWIPEVKSALPWVRSAGDRAAGNMPVQGGAQGAMKLTMAEAYDRSEEEFGRDNKWLLQIHDELVGMCKKEIVDDVTGMIQDVMWGCVPQVAEVVSIKSGAAKGERWNELDKG